MLWTPHIEALEDLDLPDKIFESLNHATQLFKSRLVPHARLEAKIILCSALQISLEEMLLQQDRKLSTLEKNTLQSLLVRRIKGEPVAYISQSKEFYGMDFFVDKNVLIPRPETEIVVEKILEHHSKADALEILELGVGSGCIVISVLKHLQCSVALGIDLSQAALTIARKNAVALGVISRITLKQSDWYENITGKFDLIIANPPYIDKKSNIYKDISFEPEIALFAEQEGLKNYHSIAAGIKTFLKKNGSCYVEIGIGAAQKVVDIFAKHGVKSTDIYKDLAQIERCIRFVV